MKILADHCVYGKTVKLLRAQGHEVITLKELGQAEAADPQVLTLAQSLDAVLVTNDKGFGNILAYPPKRYEGILVLRVTATNQQRVHQILSDFLRSHDRESLRRALVVIDAQTYRIRRG
jgi:predicted nuclease of predicted toxin-antitoxin system